jgi:hypothetical protein
MQKNQRRKPDRSLHPSLSPSAARVPALFTTYYRADEALLRQPRGFGHLDTNLSAGRLRLASVMLDVVLRCFRRVMRRMMQVALRGVRVVRSRLVVAFLVVRCRFAVMPRRVFVVFRCLVMMLCRLLRHSSSSSHSNTGFIRPEEECSRIDERIVSEL